jgi:hypothetical protein
MPTLAEHTVPMPRPAFLILGYLLGLTIRSLVAIGNGCLKRQHRSADQRPRYPPMMFHHRVLLAEDVFSWGTTRFTEQLGPKGDAAFIVRRAVHRRRRHGKPGLASFEIGDYCTNPAVVVVS